MTRHPRSERFRLSAHLGYLFSQLPLRERFGAARSAGFRAIEVPDPYHLSASQFRSLCESNNLEVAQIALPNGTSASAAKGLAALPGREAEFEEALLASIAFARSVNCRLVHPMSGTSAPLEPAPQWEVYLSNLAKACSAAGGEGLSIIIEAISERGVPGYFMNSVQQACAAIELVKAPNLFLSLDTYHASAMDAPLGSFIAENGAKIAHVQLADWPGRSEPGSGQIDFAAVFSALREIGYDGYVGLEYVPASKGNGGFDWTGCFDTYLEPLERSGAA